MNEMNTVRSSDDVEKGKDSYLAVREKSAVIAVTSSERSSYLSQIMRSLGYEVQIVHTEDELQACCCFKSPDVLLLDVDFQGIRANGYQVGMDLKRTHSDSAIIYFTDKTDG